MGLSFKGDKVSTFFRINDLDNLYIDDTGRVSSHTKPCERDCELEKMALYLSLVFSTKNGSFEIHSSRPLVLLNNKPGEAQPLTKN